MEYLAATINEHKMDQAIIFCRTKLDCDNAEQYLMSLGGGESEKIEVLFVMQKLSAFYAIIVTWHCYMGSRMAQW